MPPDYIYFPPDNTDDEDRAFTRNTGRVELTEHPDGVTIVSDRYGYLLTPSLAIRFAADLTRLALRVFEEKRRTK